MEGGWNRKSVPYCFCTALKYAHAHCPCERCNGKAVSRYTEYKHWKDSKALASAIASQRINALELTGTTDIVSDTSTTAIPSVATTINTASTSTECSTQDVGTSSIDSSTGS